VPRVIPELNAKETSLSPSIDVGTLCSTVAVGTTVDAGVGVAVDCIVAFVVWLALVLEVVLFGAVLVHPAISTDASINAAASTMSTRFFIVSSIYRRIPLL
jgi:hypothetical protein